MLYNKTATHKIMTKSTIINTLSHPDLKGGPYDNQTNTDKYSTNANNIHTKRVTHEKRA